MKKILFLMCISVLLLTSCSGKKEKVIETPTPTNQAYKSSSEESQEIVFSEGEKADIFIGSDWAIYSRYGKQVTVYNNTEQGYIKQSENNVDFVFGSELNSCEYYLTITSKDIEKLKKEYELKYDSCDASTKDMYTILSGSELTEVVYDLGDNVYMLLEVYNYYDDFLDDFESMIEIGKSEQ